MSQQVSSGAGPGTWPLPSCRVSGAGGEPAAPLLCEVKSPCSLRQRDEPPGCSKRPNTFSPSIAEYIILLWTDALGACSMTGSFMLISLWGRRIISINDSINYQESLGSCWVRPCGSFQIPPQLCKKDTYFGLIQAEESVIPNFLFQNLIFLSTLPAPSSFPPLFLFRLY